MLEMFFDLWHGWILMHFLVDSTWDSFFSFLIVYHLIFQVNLFHFQKKSFMFNLIFPTIWIYASCLEMVGMSITLNYICAWAQNVSIYYIKNHNAILITYFCHYSLVIYIPNMNWAFQIFSYLIHSSEITPQSTISYRYSN
jgi:hypothetical protein